MSGHRRHSFQRWRVAGHAGPARRRLQCCPWHWGLACHGTGPWRCGSCPVPGTRKRCLCRDNSESQQHWTQYHADCPEAGWHSATEESRSPWSKLVFQIRHPTPWATWIWRWNIQSWLQRSPKAGMLSPTRAKPARAFNQSFLKSWSKWKRRSGRYIRRWMRWRAWRRKKFLLWTCPLAVRGCRSCKLFAQSMWGWLLAKFSTEIRKRTPGEFSFVNSLGGGSEETQNQDDPRGAQKVLQMVSQCAW